MSYGGLVALASYNKFSTNILRDAITVSLGNCGTSIFAGFVVFSYIGYLSHITGQDIDKVVQAGTNFNRVICLNKKTLINKLIDKRTRFSFCCVSVCCYNN